MDEVGNEIKKKTGFAPYVESELSNLGSIFTIQYSFKKKQ